MRNHTNYVIICTKSRLLYKRWQQFIGPQAISINLTPYFRINVHHSSFTLQIFPSTSPIAVTMVTLLDVSRGCWVARRLLCWRNVCVCACVFACVCVCVRLLCCGATWGLGVCGCPGDNVGHSPWQPEAVPPYLPSMLTYECRSPESRTLWGMFRRLP